MLVESVAVTMLSRLEGMGPRRLSRLLEGSDPAQRVEQLIAGRKVDVELVGAPIDQWRHQLQVMDPAAVRAEIVSQDVIVTVAGGPGHPEFLIDDVDPAPVLFRRGAAVADKPRVAIVGTRRATSRPTPVARELGFGLAEAGVCVVSGLALGIDGAAHRGALNASATPPVAFVGGGCDVVYPKRHGDLWAQIGAVGTIASEAPPGAPPVRWRFPARNRLIAAASDVVVVVESRERGGSLLTVDEAIRRDRLVMAVPGSVRNPAAAGTNRLISEGCPPVTAVDDVLIALGLSSRHHDSVPAARQEPLLREELALVLASVDDGGTKLEQVVGRSGLAVPQVLAAIGELSGLGHVVDDGSQIRRCG